MSEEAKSRPNPKIDEEKNTRLHRIRKIIKGEIGPSGGFYLTVFSMFLGVAIAYNLLPCQYEIANRKSCWAQHTPPIPPVPPINNPKPIPPASQHTEAAVSAFSTIPAPAPVDTQRTALIDLASNGFKQGLPIFIDNSDLNYFALKVANRLKRILSTKYLIVEYSDKAALIIVVTKATSSPPDLDRVSEKAALYKSETVIDLNAAWIGGEVLQIPLFKGKATTYQDNARDEAFEQAVLKASDFFLKSSGRQPLQR